MKIRFLSIVIIFILIMGLITGCNSTYNENVKEYELQFDETMKLIDPENIYVSISQNKLSDKLEKLDGIMLDIEESVPRSKDKEFIILRQKHVFLKEIIEKGMKWDTLGGLDKLLIKEQIEIFKSEE